MSGALFNLFSGVTSNAVGVLRKQVLTQLLRRDVRHIMFNVHDTFSNVDSDAFDTLQKAESLLNGIDILSRHDLVNVQRRATDCGGTLRSLCRPVLVDATVKALAVECQGNLVRTNEFGVMLHVDHFSSNVDLNLVDSRQGFDNLLNRGDFRGATNTLNVKLRPNKFQGFFSHFQLLVLQDSKVPHRLERFHHMVSFRPTVMIDQD
mmetsp:Transcript_13132/g.21783  ORF Transcript_13132/g.21783 Transcript_13132/m.21783 type:complete len:206 (-) Transcript_13132:408-1025(-)